MHPINREADPRERKGDGEEEDREVKGVKRKGREDRKGGEKTREKGWYKWIREKEGKDNGGKSGKRGNYP